MVDSRVSAFAPEELIACTQCDLLHIAAEVGPGQTARCRRCHTPLIAPKRVAIDRTIALSLASIPVMVGALCFPFLSIAEAGLSNKASIVEIILTFTDGWYLLLGLCVLLFVVVLPLVRTGLLLYAVWPLRRGAPPWPHARHAFAWAEGLRAWVMSEIFIVGTAVSLIKIGGMATVGFGEGFWLYCVLVLIIAFQNASVCRWTIWHAMNNAKP